MRTRTWFWSFLFIALAAAAYFGGRRLGLLQAAAVPPPMDCHDTFLGVTPNITVGLSDQFHPQAFQAKIGPSVLLCTPVTEKKLPKGREPVPVKKGDHLQCYRHEVGLVGGNWLLADQFGSKRVNIQPSKYLCEPADKKPFEP